MSKKKEEVFSASQYESMYPDGCENHFWNLFRNWVIYKNLAKMAFGQILEIGCGRGFTVNYLRDKGMDACGCELSKYADPFCNEVAPYIKTNCDFTEVPEEEREQITTVLLVDVLEHIEDPKSFICSVVDTFPNLKNMLIVVPACMELWSAHDEYTGHYTRYSMESFSQLIQNISLRNLKINGMRYFFHSLYPAIMVLKSKSGSRSSEVAEVKKFWSKIFHNVVYIFFKCEYYLLSKKIKGSSLLIDLKIRQ